MTGPTQQVTETERLMLAMLAAGWTHDRIARRFGAHSRTVSRQLTGLYRRLGATNGTHAVAIAIRDGLISVNKEEDQQ